MAESRGPLAVVTDGIKHLATLAAGLSAIVLAFLDHMAGWQPFIGKYVLCPFLVSLLLSLAAFALTIVQVASGKNSVIPAIRNTALVAVIVFGFGVAMIIRVALDVSSGMSSQEANNRIEFLKMISDRDKKEETIKNWRTMFPGDTWVNEFAIAK